MRKKEERKGRREREGGREGSGEIGNNYLIQMYWVLSGKGEGCLGNLQRSI